MSADDGFQPAPFTFPSPVNPSPSPETPKRGGRRGPRKEPTRRKAAPRHRKSEPTKSRGKQPKNPAARSKRASSMKVRTRLTGEPVPAQLDYERVFALLDGLTSTEIAVIREIVRALSPLRPEERQRVFAAVGKFVA